MTSTIPTEHDKKEWARMAQAAYKVGENFTGHRYSAYAAWPSNQEMRIDVYNTLMRNYRRWLVFGEY